MEALKSKLLEKYISQRNTSLANSDVKKQAPSIKIEPDKFETKEKSKKGKIAKIALLSSVALTVTATVLASLRHKNKITPVTENIKSFFTTTGEAATKTIETAKEQTKKLGKYQKGLNNLTNVKDTYSRKLLSKIPGYNFFDKKASDLYRKILTGTMQKSYNKVEGHFKEANDVLLETIKTSDITPKKAESLKKILEKRTNSILNFANKEQVFERIQKVDSSMDGIDIEGAKTFKETLLKGIKNLRRFGSESISENKLKKAGELHHQIIKKDLGSGLTEKEAEELQSFIRTYATPDVVKKIKKADKYLEKVYKKEVNDMFGKLRDINFGCAPTDILGILGTCGLLTLYTAQADTKEEKVKVALTTGIPLLVSFGTTLFATTKMINGIKSLALGLSTGLIANTAGKIINEKYQKSHNIEEVPNTIVTLDDYAEKFKTAGKNLIK